MRTLFSLLLFCAVYGTAAVRFSDDFNSSRALNAPALDPGTLMLLAGGLLCIIGRIRFRKN